MSGRLHLLATLLGCAGLASCLSGEWNREVVRQPVDPAVLAELPTSGVPLDRCLERLGAPTYVWEHDVHGLICAWSWANDRTLGATISAPVHRSMSASLEFNDIRQNEEGLVLWFDHDWVLERWRRGSLSALVGGARRPATIEEIEGS